MWRGIGRRLEATKRVGNEVVGFKIKVLSIYNVEFIFMIYGCFKKLEV